MLEKLALVPNAKAPPSAVIEMGRAMQRRSVAGIGANYVSSRPHTAPPSFGKIFAFRHVGAVCVGLYWR